MVYNFGDEMEWNRSPPRSSKCESGKRFGALGGIPLRSAVALVGDSRGRLPVRKAVGGGEGHWWVEVAGGVSRKSCPPIAHAICPALHTPPNCGQGSGIPDTGADRDLHSLVSTAVISKLFLRPMF